MRVTPGLRFGFTVAELLVSLSLLAVVVLLVLHTLSSHQKVFRGMRHRILLGEQLRDGEAALVSDLRGAALSADTLRMMSDSAVEFFATIGSSVLCGEPSGQTVSLVPADLASRVPLTSIPVSPDTGDIAAIYSAADTISRVRRWQKFRISAVGSVQAATACPPETGFTTLPDASKPAYKITLLGSLQGIGAGAPVRLLRRGRYSLYKSSDGDWYLGYKRCNAVAAGCSTVQPVSGSYLPYTAASGGGMQLRYLDSAGNAIPSFRAAEVIALQITFRGAVAAAGRTDGQVIDSVVVTVTPRNIH